MASRQSETYTESWEPERCPFCELDGAQDRIAELEAELEALPKPTTARSRVMNLDDTEATNYLKLAANSDDQWFRNRALKRAEAENAQLKYELTTAQAENEKLRGRVAEYQESLARYIRESERLKRELDETVDVSPSWLLRKQAEAVVPAIMVAGREFGRGDLTYSALRMFAEDYTQHLHQQADELEQPAK